MPRPHSGFIVRVPLTVTAGAYTANDTLGGEHLITDAARQTGVNSGMLMGITAVIEDDTSAAWDASDISVLIFDSNPEGTYTDNATLASALTDADAGTKLLDAIPLSTKHALGNITMLKARNLDLPFQGNGANDLYAVAINVAGTTPAATDAITLLYHIVRD